MGKTLLELQDSVLIKETQLDSICKKIKSSEQVIKINSPNLILEEIN